MIVGAAKALLIRISRPDRVWPEYSMQFVLTYEKEGTHGFIDWGAIYPLLLRENAVVKELFTADGCTLHPDTVLTMETIDVIQTQACKESDPGPGGVVG